MYIALISIIIFVCVLLVLVVLAQNPKGGGLSSQFGGSTSQLMGVKRTGDLLEKLTWGFAITLVVLTLGTHMMLDTAGEGQIRSINEERARQSQLPAAPGALPGAVEENATIPDAGDIPEMVDTANDAE
ncbi:preprotein translocase subunit SecG [Pontibacter ummariensis]|uniref:Protein-export membrane protein SecG n=1 Tax=Pontibacter ummariensis TaxID=1610492 RepID=A0A239BPU5_9BACT|nr:preprotein translocase subunit SecG [Pontibacter ummariensis]PRY15723.1 preprotein translocase subunit SecG [Pontibacter ummariensis]SNS09388.1 preprotein translocase subunit SecG [Pontibacter ummariensis]